EIHGGQYQCRPELSLGFLKLGADSHLEAQPVVVVAVKHNVVRALENEVNGIGAEEDHAALKIHGRAGVALAVVLICSLIGAHVMKADTAADKRREIGFSHQVIHVDVQSYGQ